MKNTSFITFLLLICLSLIAFKCDDDITQEDEKAELENFRYVTKHLNVSI